MSRTKTTEGGHSCPPREVGNIPTEIGTIAADWRIAPLDAVCELPQYGFTASAEAKGNVRFLRITDITDSGVKWPTVPFCECPEKELGKYRLASGDIVFARIGATTGKSYLITNPPPSVFASYLIRVRAKREIYPAFLSQFFRSDAYWRQVDAQKNANLKKGVSGSVLKTLLVPVPPLPEQRKIAGVLGVVQRAMEQQERLLALTAELKKALLHQLFTAGLRGEAQKQTDLGPVPESWQVATLEDAAVAFDYGTSVKCEHGKAGVPVLRIPNVVGGSIDLSDLKHGQPKRNELEQLRLRDGDLLFVRTNGVLENAGRCALYRSELDGCYFASYLIRVRVDSSKVLPAFVNEYARTEQGRRFLSGRAIRTADGKFNINSGTLRRMLLPLPSLDEQKEMVRQLDLVERKLKLHERKHATLTDLFRTLLHQLMTAQIRVHDLDLPELAAQAQET